MMKLRTVRTAVYAVLVLAFTLTTDAFQNPQARRSPKSSSLMVTPAKDEYKQALLNDRRKAMGSIFGAAAIAAALVTTGRIEDARALDMDAFVNSQLDQDTKNCDPKKDPKCAPKLTEDEALCKYGQSGEARAAACKRFKAVGGALPAAGSQGRSLGGAYAI